ncbi:MAG: type VI secretion system tip protein VgrG [Deltaproteobacteria bacterium]|nr:type VI secretion system tip protein VgrG [Deltaproteobacteria bacterium]
MALDPVSYTFEINNQSSTWQIRRFKLTERLFELYIGNFEIIHPTQTADIDSLLGVSCTVTLTRATAVSRRINGIIHRVKRVGTDHNNIIVSIEVVPALWSLTQRITSRIFQNISVLDIITKVLNEALAPLQRTIRNDTHRSLPEREYCVQYQETDFDFVRRLMQEEGLSFYFDQSGSTEQVVLVDDNATYPTAAGQNAEVYSLVDPGSSAGDFESVHRIQSEQALMPTSMILNEYDWRQPNMMVHIEQHETDVVNQERVIYDCEPALNITDNGNDRKERLGIRHEQEQVNGHPSAGDSNAINFTSGCIFELRDLNSSDLEARYLITEVVHEGTAPGAFSQDANADVEYYNHFVCISENVVYRPPLHLRRPFLGTLTATVVGPKNEEIQTDKHGRIKVRFHWDLLSPKNGESSCWIRVMQSWAGPGYGTVFIPRIGMEVIVQFVQGNADLPLVTGCLYNGLNRPPLTLPQDKTKSTITSRSSRNNLGFNELTFEDATGSEEIILHAQKDLNAHILHNQTYNIDSNDRITVGGSQTINIGGNQSITVGADRSLQVNRDESTTIARNRTVTVNNDQTTLVANNRSTTIVNNDDQKVVGDRSIDIAKNYTNNIGINRNVNIGVNDDLQIGSSQNIKIAAIKTESIGGASLETIGGAKTLTVGGAYAVSVGGAINTMVAGAHLEETGLLRAIKAGKKISISCGGSSISLNSSGIELSCGASKISLSSGGKVTITGTEFEFTASGQIKLKGGMVYIN